MSRIILNKISDNYMIDAGIEERHLIATRSPALFYKQENKIKTFRSLGLINNTVATSQTNSLFIEIHQRDTLVSTQLPNVYAGSTDFALSAILVSDEIETEHELVRSESTCNDRHYYKIDTVLTPGAHLYFRFHNITTDTNSNFRNRINSCDTPNFWLASLDDIGNGWIRLKIQVNDKNISNYSRNVQARKSAIYDNLGIYIFYKKNIYTYNANWNNPIKEIIDYNEFPILLLSRPSLGLAIPMKSIIASILSSTTKQYIDSLFMYFSQYIQIYADLQHIFDVLIKLLIIESEQYESHLINEYEFVNTLFQISNILTIVLQNKVNIELQTNDITKNISAINYN